MPFTKWVVFDLFEHGHGKRAFFDLKIISVTRGAVQIFGFTMRTRMWTSGCHIARQWPRESSIPPLHRFLLTSFSELCSHSLLICNSWILLSLWRQTQSCAWTDATPLKVNIRILLSPMIWNLWDSLLSIKLFRLVVMDSLSLFFFLWVFKIKKCEWTRRRNAIVEKSATSFLTPWGSLIL